MSACFPDSSVGKESTCNAGDSSSIPGLGRSSGEGIGYPLQYSWASLVAQLVKNPPAMWETWVLPGYDSWIGKVSWKRERLLLLLSHFSRVRLFVTHGLYSPWNSPGQNTGVGSLSLLQRIFPTQELNWGLLHCRRTLYQLSYQAHRYCMA